MSELSDALVMPDGESSVSGCASHRSENLDLEGRGITSGITGKDEKMTRCFD